MLGGDIVSSGKRGFGCDNTMSGREREADKSRGGRRGVGAEVYSVGRVLLEGLGLESDVEMQAGWWI
jgi:hypothetical protein